ncbi:MAG: RNA polymerase sigma factor [Kangiellaceae bacterium]|nr:RNA polymerase sigma factor [Kangiellaceae bacterium]
MSQSIQITSGQVDRWIEAAISGDINSFEHLYRAYHRRLLMFCTRLCGEQSLAEEVVQEAFVKAWQGLPGFKQQSQFYTWLRTIASRVVIDRIRLKSHQIWENSVEFDSEIAAHHPESGAKIDLDKLILKLPHGARSVLVLHDIEGYSHQEIGNLLNIATGTSKAQLARARMLLRELYLAGSKQ